MELIVAAAENGVIGRAGALPWRLRADLKRFKALTMGRPILMGRKTYESIGRPLPGRTNIILSRAATPAPPGCVLAQDLAAARQAAARAPGGDAGLMVIGGAEIYRQCLPEAKRIHLTLVHANVEGDTVFDGWRGADWRERDRERHEADADNSFAYSFITLERR